MKNPYKKNFLVFQITLLGCTPGIYFQGTSPSQKFNKKNFE